MRLSRPLSVASRRISSALLGAAALLLTACGPAGVRADEADTSLRRIDFQVERSREVAHDRIAAVLRVTHDDVDPARLASRVNEAMAWALERSRVADDVDVRTARYHTAPIRDRQRITGWTASQELVLEGAEFERVTELVGVLQERLQLVSLRFSVSDALRRRTEDVLLAEVIGAYQERAALILESLGADGHELVSLRLSTGGAPPVMPVRLEAARMSAQVAPPAVEGGTSTLRVVASATIELR